MRNFAVAVCLSLALPVSALAAIQGKEVEYKADDVTMKGYLAYDDAVEGKRPGVLVVHEWWGHNEYARKRADMLAEMGYTALAVDMYGDGKTADHPKDAKAFSSAVFSDMDAAKARFNAALDTLTANETVDAEKTAAIGYCFGGGVVLHMARFGVDLDGVASFHGSLATKAPAEKGEVKAAVFVANGEADKMVKAEDVENFKKEMEAAGVTYEYHGYPEVMHSFTNPGADAVAEEFGLPLAYDEHADKDSWAKLQDFFKTIFQ
jgi:dienelactone hydrolase